MNSKRITMVFAILVTVALATALAVAQAPAPAAGQGGPPAAGAPGAGGPGGGGRGPGGPGGGQGGRGRGGGGPLFTVTTGAWPDGDVIPAKYSFAGEKKSPAFDFKWVTGGAALTEVPAPATLQSYAIVFHDIENIPNAQTGEDTLHWMIWDIPGTAKGIPEALAAGDLPDGSKQAMSGIGRGSYFGPGAGPGPYHHYIFEFYALDIKLNLPATTPRADVMKAMNGHVIGKSAFTGRYRNQ